jgi:hypothetical protein
MGGRCPLNRPVRIAGGAAGLKLDSTRGENVAKESEMSSAQRIRTGPTGLTPPTSLAGRFFAGFPTLQERLNPNLKTKPKMKH